MKVLMINKFLHPNGGSETYIFRLGQCLTDMGHEVQFFGMEHEGRCVGNRVGAYTAEMDFHHASALEKVTYPLQTIYSADARRKLRLVLADFQPDVCHLNNFNYQLTPSIILEIVKWRRETGRACRIVFTAHDFQLVCPNHMLNNPVTHENCEKCLGGHFLHCVKGRCIHGSAAKSAIGAAEALLWNAVKVYRHMDVMICCSRFLKAKLDTNPLFAGKTLAMHNFVDRPAEASAQKQDYVLYFGRYSGEKGVELLLEAAKALPEVPFVFAGRGPLEGEIARVPNIRSVGFQSGEALEKLIREARFSVCPSRWYENCPFSVMESITHGTPVLGADIGGIPELIVPGVTGELFTPGDAADLTEKLRRLWEQPETTAAMAERCRAAAFDTAEEYASKLIRIYGGESA